ncbi:uncharacterized protein FIESC28_08159 [Fusarium coffeatum]|uniref:Uncharacterized protein n=1 Tax=Fusarium coffeatum TaxID=231269 RepID=A0A366R8P5_9HYPO|nr:uncharacterized protein FIESC28_08159 [Fusarium coffeatum]RBR13531.1 hypothetical protein FIESC28_08159 [Fusarium coffeatum]
MAMPVQSHKTSHSLPTTDLRASLHGRQRPRYPQNSSTCGTSVDDHHTRSSSSLSCYSAPERFQRRNLKDEAAGQLRSFSACSGRIIRPPLQLSQRRFLSEGQISQARPAFISTSHFDPRSHGDVEPSSPASQERHFMTALHQRQKPGIAFESDTELDKRYTFGPLEPLPTPSSRWSDSSYGEGGTVTPEEEELTDNESSHIEIAGIEDTLSHFSIIQAHRVSIHTWVLKPTTIDINPDSQSKLCGWNPESIVGPPCPKEAKRWGIIF